MGIEKIETKNSNNNLKEKIIWWREGGERNIAEEIYRNPEIITERMHTNKGIFVVESLIKIKSEIIVKSIIDLRPEILNLSYADLEDINKNKDTKIDEEPVYKKHIIAYNIAIEFPSLIVSMLEKNKDIVENDDFVRYAIEFGSDEIKKYLIDNFTCAIFDIDWDYGKLFAQEILENTDSLDVINNLEEKLKSSGYVWMFNFEDKNFISLKEHIKNFKTKFLRKDNVNNRNNQK